MATTAVPGLRSLFDDLSIGLDDAIFICQGQDVSGVLEAAKETATDWDDDALTEELQKQCPTVLKELEKEKKAEEKAAAAEEKQKEKEKKDEEKKKAAAKKNEEKQKNDDEDKKKKAAEKKKKDDEDKKKKAAADKKKAEEKKKQDEEKKKEKAAADKKKKEQDEENKKKKAVTDKKKAEEKAKKDEEDKKKKEEEKKKKAVKDKQKQEEKKKQDEENKKKKAAADKKKEQENKKKKAEKMKKDAEKKKKKEEEKKRKEEKKQTDLEARGIPGGEYNARERPFSKTVTDDPCCACAKGCADCCKAFSFIFMFLLYPGIYLLMLYGEYSTYGFERFLARANGGGFNVTDDDMNGVAAAAAPKRFLSGGDGGDGADASASSSEGGGSGGGDDAAAPVVTLEDNPLVWILPLLGVGHGLFTNMVPISGSLILMPLFQSLEVTKSSGATLALCSLIQSVSNGLLGWTMWMARDPRFLVCRALFLLVPCGWIGYLVGVTSHLSLKDVLLAINDSIDDDYEGATHSMRETIDEADIALLHCYLRIALGCFMVMMSVFVLIGVCAGGMARFCCCQTVTGGSIKGCKGCCSWLIAMYCSLSTGYLFVATIGAGMACTTYFILAMFLGIETKRAMPTAIIIGGWTAWVPTVMNYVVLEGAAGYVRFLMMFPGLWFGAVFSPWFSRCGGPTCDMFWYFLCLVTVGTAVVCTSAIAIQNEEEDLDINIKPMIYLDSLEAAFDATNAPAASPTIAPVVKAVAKAVAGGKGGKGGAMW